MEYSTNFSVLDPDLPELVTEFREATFERKKEMLDQMITWTIKQGNIASSWTLDTDWCKSWQGYVLLNNRGLLPVCWNRKINDGAESRYSSELGDGTAAIWALKDIMVNWRGAPIKMCSDSKDFILTFQNLQNITDHRLLFRIDCLLGIPQLTVHFTPSEFNKIAEMFSRCNEQQFRIESVQTNDISDDLWKNVHRGHSDVDKTWENLRLITNEFTRKEVETKLRHCGICQQFTRLQPSDPLHSFPEPIKPGEFLDFDFICRLPRALNEKCYLLVIVDYLSRWFSVGVAHTADSSIVIEGLTKWRDTYGQPERLLCDPASYHKSKLLKKWCSDRNLKLLHTVPRAHKSNGLVERLNQTLVGRIRRIYAEGTYADWTETLPEAVAAI